MPYANNEETLRDFYGRIIGYVRTDQRGNKTYYDFQRRTVAKYDGKQTRDFYGLILGSGDLGMSQLFRFNKQK